MYMIDFATGIATNVATQQKEQMTIRDGKVFAFGVELTPNNTIIL